MNPRVSTWLIAAVFCALAAPAYSQSDARRGAEFVEQGNKLLAESKFKEALAAFDEARTALPESPEVAYDRGIALYRLGEFEKAQAAFQDAMKPGHPELEAAAKFNLGRCAHEAAIAKKDEPKAAIADVNKAINFYGDSTRMAPRDGDPKKNIELAEKLRAYLELRLKQEEQQKKQQNPSSQPTSQPEKSPTSQPQKQEPSSQPSSQPQEQQKGGEKKQDSEKNEQQQDGEEKKDEEQKNQDSKKGQEKKGPQQKPQQNKGGEAEEKKDEASEDQPSKAEESQKQDEKEMKEQSVEPMLQEARDMERKRREAKRAQMMRIRGRVPVKKDW